MFDSKDFVVRFIIPLWDNPFVNWVILDFYAKSLSKKGKIHKKVITPSFLGSEQPVQPASVIAFFCLSVRSSVHPSFCSG